jgi:hypothetical protein
MLSCTIELVWQTTGVNVLMAVIKEADVSGKSIGVCDWASMFLYGKFLGPMKSHLCVIIKTQALRAPKSLHVL